jgi:hypothetical protein
VRFHRTMARPGVFTSVSRRMITILVHNSMPMRRLTLLPACLALLEAFIMAPYQHVHPKTGHEERGDQHESTVVHAHFFAVSVPISPNSEPVLDHAHKDHTSVSLDTFRTFPQSAPLLFFQPELPVRVFVPTESAVRVEIIEPCGHDPPCVENTVPRAPPV